MRRPTEVTSDDILKLSLFSLDSAQESIYWVNPDGRFVYVNDESCRELDYSRDELLSMSVVDIDPDRHPQSWPAHWQEVKTNKSIRFETIHRRKDGTLFPVEMVVNYLSFGESEFLCSFARDITERKRIEESLRASEELLRQFVEHVPAAVEMFDREMRYLLVSNKFRTDYGFEGVDLVGRSHYDVFPESIKWKDVHERCLRGAVEVCDEDMVTYADGKVDWLRWEVRPWRDKSGSIGGLMIFSELITERKQAAEALKKSEEKYRVLVERISDWVWEVDENCVYTYVSPRIRILLGYEPEEVIGKTCFDFMAPEEAERVAKTFNPIVRRRESFALLENTLVHKDGRLFTVETSGEPVFDEAGNFSGYRGIDRDITEKKRAEEALKESAARETEARKTIQRQYILLQRALMPIKPFIGQGYRAADVYVPISAGQDIGGDFYDVFHTESGKIAVIIGDVAGKDIEAATLAAATRSTVRAFAYEISSAGEALTHSNTVICDQKQTSGTFVTVFLAILDPANGRIIYATAGHPPPAIRRKDGQIEFLGFGQPPLGILEEMRYKEAESYLEPGDKLICYTDGISEARRNGEMFEVNGIENALAAYGGLEVEVVVDKLADAASDWAEGHLSDDIAILAIEREPGGS